MDATAAIVSVLTGAPFGYALTRGRMTAPEVIRDQFRMKDWRMMKMFLAATATGATVLVGGHVLGLTSLAPIHVKELRPVANFVGGALLGAGMHITGSCPGTVWAQLGDATNAAAPWVLTGGMIGASLYAGIDRFSREYLGHMGGAATPDSLHVLLGLSWATTATALVAGMSGMIYALNKYFPSKPRSEVTEHAWEPVNAGIVIGSLQIPTFILSHTALGASSAYVALAGGAMSLAGTSNNYLITHASSAKSVGQLIQNLAMIGGAYVATTHLLRDHPDKPKSKPNPLTLRSRITYVAGGALLLFGSRLADGCTSGHGLSGVAQLALSSMLAVAGMFAGGFLTAAVAPSPVAPGQ